MRAGDFPEAIRWLQRAISLKPEKAALHFQLAQAHAQLRQIPQAIQEMEEGLKYTPEDQAAKRLLQQLRGF